MHRLWGGGVKVTSRTYVTIWLTVDYREDEIEHSMGKVRKLPFDFDSRDIGMTQGTTIRYGNEIIAQYRPGTGHWYRAVELAEKVLRTAVEYMVDRGDSWAVENVRLALQLQLAGEDILFWDGRDIPTSDDPPDWGAASGS